MTREEAIKWFRENPFYHKDHVPFNMAIKALEQEPKLLQALEQEKGAYNALVKNIQCSDCISRQELLDAFWKLDVELRPNAIDTILGMVKNLPSVNPQEQKTNRAKHEVNETSSYYSADAYVFNDKEE